MSNETLQDRQDYLFLVTDNLIHQRDTWADDASLQGLPSGGLLWMAAEQLVNAFAMGTIPGCCRQLCRAVEEFTRHWESHTTRAEVSPTDDLLPGNNVWSAIDSVAAARTGAEPKEVKRLEPVADLVSQKVSDEQIAKIYGWKTSLGQWDYDKVRDAKAHPGKHDGDKFYDEKQQEKDRRDRLDKQRAEAMSQNISGKKNAAPIAGPEPIETLVAQGLTVAQIASVKVLSVEAVLEYCRINSVALDGIAPASPTPSAINPTPAAESQLEHDQFDEGIDNEGLPIGDGSELSLEQQILNAADNDPESKPGDIAKLLRVSPQKVTAILKRRAEVEQVA